MNKILNKLQNFRIRFNTSQMGANPGDGVFWLRVDGSITGVGGGAINGKTYKWKFTVCLQNDTWPSA